MERGIFSFIWKHSSRDQIALVLLSAATLPLLYLSFDLPKTIINQAIGGEGGFPRAIFGIAFEQIPYLLLLCGAFLALVLLNGAFKFVTSTYRYRVGDRLLRRLRYMLIEQLLRFPVKEFRTTSGGQVVSMVTAETSPLGFFMAEALVVPTLAVGTLATVVLFMFMQDWMMGIAAIALYPLQIYLIPRIQRQVNTLQREEVMALRTVADGVTELVAGAHEIHGHDTAQYELATFTHRLSRIFEVRVQIATKRYTINILNQFFAQLTPFFFLSIGGYLVIKGDLSLGALVAALAAYKEMYAPSKDLIDYYQKAEDARVKYGQLREYFAPPGIMDHALIHAEPELHDLNGAHLSAANVVIEADQGMKPLDGASISLQLPVHAAVIGGSDAGREEFARLLSRQVQPHAGSVSLGKLALGALPDSVTGRRIGYVGPESWLGTGTFRDVLTYPLRRRPAKSDGNGDEKHAHEQREAALTGNSRFDLAADWIDYAAAGCSSPDQLLGRMITVLRITELEREVFEIGLRRTLDPEAHPELAQRFVGARRLLHERIEARHLAHAVEAFDPEAYLDNASVAENILFGTPAGAYFALDKLDENDYLLGVIESAGLTGEFLEKGLKLAAIMADIFRDLPPGHEFFERFGFIRAEELRTFDSLRRRADTDGAGSLTPAERARLMALPFKLVAAQHHVGLIDAGFRKRVLAARAAFARSLPSRLRSAVQFFTPDSYNAAGSISDNVLFGKLATDKPGDAAQVNALVGEVIGELGLRPAVINLGLDYGLGVGASRLSAAQRQKLAIARCLLKRPDLLILNDALAALEPAAQQSVFEGVRAEMLGRSLLLLEPGNARAAGFERVFGLENGKIIERSGSASTTGITATTGTTSTTEAVIPDSLQAPEGDVDIYDLVAILTRIPLFAGIDRSRLKLLAFTSEMATYEAGQIVFRQGDAGDKAYVIIEGSADVVLESAEAGSGNGNSDDGKIVAQLEHHQLFGEMALLSSLPRATTIRARSRLSLLVLSHDIFMRLLEENSGIAISMTRILAERLATTLRDYARLGANNAGIGQAAKHTPAPEHRDSTTPVAD